MAGYVEEYDDLLNGTFLKYLELSEKIGGVVKEQADIVKDAFHAQRQFLSIVHNYNKPVAESDLRSILKPTSDKMSEIQTHREKNRSSEYFNHLSTVSESSQILGWVLVIPDPSKFAKELHAAGAYYGNKVITMYKNKDPTHSEWAKAYLEVLLELHQYIREFHRTGITWNRKAPPATASSSAQNAGTIPAPPPPPPPELFDSQVTPSAGSGDPRAALFKELNQGADITKCLKKVDKTVAKEEKPVATVHSAKWHNPASSAVKKPPKFVLEGRKWCIENQKGAQLTVSNATMNQSVSIYKCEDTIITVDSKVNCITMDSCKKASVVFNDIVSFVEFINCQSVKGQSLGTLPTLTIDNSDGVQIFLNNNSVTAEIITSKSSEINLNVPAQDGFDYIELPVPEQLKTTIIGEKLATIAIHKN